VAAGFEPAEPPRRFSGNVQVENLHPLRIVLAAGFGVAAGFEPAESPRRLSGNVQVENLHPLLTKTCTHF
jgi:hypothetical protein